MRHYAPDILYPITRRNRHILVLTNYLHQSYPVRYMSGIKPAMCTYGQHEGEY